jgi:hypothetical protein
VRLLPANLRTEKRVDVERLHEDHGWCLLRYTGESDWEVVAEAWTWPGVLIKAARLLHPHPVKEALYPDGWRTYLEMCGAATLGGLLGVGATIVTCWALDVAL